MAKTATIEVKRGFVVMLDRESDGGGPLVLVRGDVTPLDVVAAAAAILRPLVARDGDLVERTVGEMVELLDVPCDCPACTAKRSKTAMN